MHEASTIPAVVTESNMIIIIIIIRIMIITIIIIIIIIMIIIIIKYLMYISLLLMHTFCQWVQKTLRPLLLSRPKIDIFLCT